MAETVWDLRFEDGAVRTYKTRESAMTTANRAARNGRPWVDIVPRVVDVAVVGLAVDDGRRKVSEDDVWRIRFAVALGPPGTATRLAKQLGVSKTQISHIASGRAWRVTT